MSKKICMLLCLLLTAAMVLTAAGCSGDAAQNKGGTEDASSEAAAETSGEEVTLEFWNMPWGNSGEFDVLEQEIVKRYSEVAPNVTIKYTNNPWANWFEMYSTAVAAGDAPDVAAGGGFMPFQFAVNGEAADLQWIMDQFKAEGQYDDYVEGVLDFYVYDGVTVGLPFNFDTRTISIRKDWLEEMGLDMPTTYDEFIDVAKAFSAKGDDYYGCAFGVVTDSASPFIIMGMGNGGVFYDKEGNADVNNEHNLQVMKLFRTLKDEGCLPDGIENYGGDEAIALFEGGYAGIMIKSVKDYTNAYEALGEDKVCIVPPLTSPAGENKILQWINGYMIFAQTEHMQESLEFLKWYSENNEEIWSSGALSGYPARQSFWGSDVMKTDMRQAVIQNVLPNGVTMCYPLANGTASASSIDGLNLDMKFLQAALATDPDTWEDTLQDIEDQCQDLIDELDP